MHLRRLAALLALPALGLSACAGGEGPSLENPPSASTVAPGSTSSGSGTASAGATASTSPTASASGTATTGAAPGAGASPSLSPDQALAQALAKYAEKTPPPNVPAVTGAAGREPAIARPAGAAPKKVVIKDLVQGTGKEVAVNDTVTVHYKGIAWDTGKVFDSSWKTGKPVTFPLARLIPGWQLGIPKMKEGGRRELVIPPELAYGPKAAGNELGGKTLVFVIDAVKAGA